MKSILFGFIPQFLFFDLEDNQGITYAESSTSDSNEYYQLVQCCDNKPCLMDTLPVRFKFTGEMSNGLHPDDLVALVLTKITDINANEYTGCFKLVEADCYPEFKELEFQDFFFKVETTRSCSECEKPVVVEPMSLTPMTYAQSYYNGLDVDRVENTMIDYAQNMHQKMMSIRHGIKFCCEENLMDLKIELELINFELTNNPQICCPVPIS